jgi:hypothetical protein
MIDNFSLLLTHGLMLVAAWRLLRRPDLDQEGAPSPFARFGRRAGQSPEGTPGA